MQHAAVRKEMLMGAYWIFKLTSNILPKVRRKSSLHRIDRLMIAEARHKFTKCQCSKVLQPKSILIQLNCHRQSETVSELKRAVDTYSVSKTPDQVDGASQESGREAIAASIWLQNDQINDRSESQACLRCNASRARLNAKDTIANIIHLNSKWSLKHSITSLESRTCSCKRICNIVNIS